MFQQLIFQIEQEIMLIYEGKSSISKIYSLARQYAQNRKGQLKTDIAVLRKTATSPFKYCNRLVNDLRESLIVRSYLIQKFEFSCLIKFSNIFLAKSILHRFL